MASSTACTKLRGRPDGYAWLLLPILLLGMGLGLYQLGADSLWLDEILTALRAQKPTLSAVLDNLNQLHHPPLHVVIVYWISFLGHDEFWLRLPSVAFGVLGLVTTYKVGQVLVGKWEGMLAAFLLAISPFYVHYCQEARAYALFTWISLLSLYFLLQARRSRRLRWWVGFTVASILNTYTHFFSAFVLASEILASGLLLAIDSLVLWRAGKPPSELWTKQRRSLTAFLASLVVIALGVLPGLSSWLGLLNKHGSSAPQAAELRLSVRFFMDVLNQLSVGMSQDRHVSIHTWVFFLLFLLGLLASVLRRRYRTILWVLIWITFPFLVLAVTPSNHFLLHATPSLSCPCFCSSCREESRSLGGWLAGGRNAGSMSAGVEQAVAAYQQALALEPENGQAKQWLKALQP